MKKLKHLFAIIMVLSFLLTLATPVTANAEAAPPASRVTYIGHYVNDNGHDICVVRIDGYGAFQTATIDGVRVNRIDIEYIQRGRTVVAFLESYDCGVLSSGTHEFVYKITPINTSQRPDLYAFGIIHK